MTSRREGHFKHSVRRRAEHAAYGIYLGGFCAECHKLSQALLRNPGVPDFGGVWSSVFFSH